MYADLENLLVSSKKVIEYTQLPPEGDLVKKGDEKHKGWPQQGRVEFKNVSMRYREHLDLALRDMDFQAQPGMKVGIVGRTGAGKSTILQVLFRLVEVAGGDILIDDLNIKDLGLHLLRKNIAYIP